MDRSLDKLLAVLDEHGARLHALLTRITLRADVAEDLLQELFLKLRAADGFHAATDPAAYARQAAVHLACDWRRRQRRTPVGCPTVEPAAAADSPLAALVRREEMEQVLAALADLPDLGRTCLVLHYLDHQPYEAIALALGKTAHQVRALCAKAIAQLRDVLRDEPPGRLRNEVPHENA